MTEITLPGAKAQRAMNEKLFAATGWRIELVHLDVDTGSVRVEVSCVEGEDGNQKRLVTLDRSCWSGQVTETREIGWLRWAGFCRGFYWDFSQSFFLGRRHAEGLRHGLRMLSRYIDDNRPAGRLGSSGAALRMLADACASVSK